MKYEKAIFLCSNGARSNEQLFKGQCSGIDGRRHAI